jgi:hypothetical protein
LKEKREEKSYMKGKGTISHAYRYINKMVRVLDQQHLFNGAARVSVQTVAPWFESQLYRIYVNFFLVNAPHMGRPISTMPSANRYSAARVR